MMQLEGSGNWPVDDVAIEKTKSAFILKIGERWVMFAFMLVRSFSAF